MILCGIQQNVLNVVNGIDNEDCVAWSEALRIDTKCGGSLILKVFSLRIRIREFLFPGAKARVSSRVQMQVIYICLQECCGLGAWGGSKPGLQFTFHSVHCFLIKNPDAAAKVHIEAMPPLASHPPSTGAFCMPCTSVA